MRFMISTAALTMTLGATALAGQLNLAIGASVPAMEQTLVMTHAPTRSSGGEHFIFTLSQAKNITSVKLSGFSASRLGKVLVHSATGVNGKNKVALDGLSNFKKVTAGNPTNYNGSVMLTDSNWVEVTPNQAFNQIDISVEGYTNDDSSLLIQITSTDSLNVEDFLATRTGPNKETLGGLIDESRYAQFSPSQLSSLMTRAANPTVVQMAGKNYQCTSYTKLNPVQVNFKTRAYSATAQGGLQSTSELEGGVRTWSPTAKGMVMSIENYNGCGKYTTYNVLKMINTGSLVSEIVVDLEAYIKLCAAAGYDAEAVRAVEMNSTFPSVVDPKYVVDSYEFCRAL